jgi:tetratricopeptide (TPR) repeat protein
MATRATSITTLALALAGAAALGAGGCADALTFSKAERTEGRIALGEGDHETATLIFLNQTRRSPKDYKAHFYLGQARWASGLYPEAVTSFHTALQVMELSASGQSDDAYRIMIIEDLARALSETDADGSKLAAIEARSKGDAWLKLLIARTHAESGRPDAAINAYQSARRLDRGNALIAKSFGLYLESVRQEVAAEEVLRRAYALDPRDEEVAAGLRRMGVVPGPSIRSKNDLARPAMPLGPLPQVKLHRPEGQTAGAGNLN